MQFKFKICHFVLSHISNQYSVVEAKVSLIGPADAGKTSLIKFLKGCNIKSEDNLGVPIQKYNETWGIKVNIIEWVFEEKKNKDERVMRFDFWESGAMFLKKFDFYN